MLLRRTLIALLALCALAVPATADAAQGNTLDRFPQEARDAFGSSLADGTLARMYGGTLLPVPGAGQLWQVYTDVSRTGVLVRDADSRRVVGSFTLGTGLRRATVDSTGGGEWLHATDGGTRVFVVTTGLELLEIDAGTFATRSLGRLTVPVDLPLVFGPIVPASLTFDAATGDLLVLYGGTALSPTNVLTVLQRIDLDTAARTNRVVRSCTGPLPGTDVGSDTSAPELLFRADAVYVTCQRVLVPAPFGSPTGAVVRLPRASLWEAAGEETATAAGARVDTALVDPAGGRIAVVGAFGEVTVVDAASMSVVGTFRVGTGPFGSPPNVGAGLDRTSGRFHFQSHLGYGSVDLRSTPLAAPVVDTAAAADGQERIVADGNRVYVLTGTGLTGKAGRYSIN